jgi:HD-like signal output (HDOD) protein
MSAAPSTAFSREKLLQVARSLPADLHVLSHLGEMLQDVNSDLGQIADLLRRDVALAARIVRISNSPMFAGGGQIGSTEEAVNRVGFSAVLKLVGTATAARLTDRAVEAYGIRADALRSNMLFVASAAEVLARAAGLDPRVAYTAGLLRTLGMMVLDRAGRGQLGPAQAYSAARWPGFSTWEGSVFGVNHGEVAALILDEWRFPAELGSAIRAHYLAHDGDWEQALAVLLNVANGAARRAGYGFFGEASWWEITDDKLRTLGVREEDVGCAMGVAEAALETTAEALAA